MYNKLLPLNQDKSLLQRKTVEHKPTLTKKRIIPGVRIYEIGTNDKIDMRDGD